VKLSEEQLVDCAWGYFGNQACDGGFAPGAYSYLMNAGGVALESTYPYLEEDGWCNVNDLDSGVVVTGYFNITDVSQLVSAVGNGPVAIAIDASLPSFRFYQDGIYNDPACQTDADSLDHEVTAVGYGTDQTTGDNYVIIDNSWSTHWGHFGSVKFLAGSGANWNINTCGMATSATGVYVQ
jgi:cathepsin L